VAIRRREITTSYHYNAALSRWLRIQVLSLFLRRLRYAQFIPVEPDCSSCPVLNALGSLVYHTGTANRVESAALSGLPFEPERDRMVNAGPPAPSERTPIRSHVPLYRIAVPLRRNRYLRSNVWLAQPLRPGFQFKPAPLNPRIGSG